MRWLVWAVLACGCVHDNLVACGDELCPIASVCTPGGCASADAAAACVGLDDNAPCTLDGAAGFCIGGACKEARCGDGFVDPDEVCDDGNQEFGDGCAGSCRSLEVCGNGITDPIVGEFCDDGNHISSDGCASACKLEVLNWRDVSHLLPDTREGHSMTLGPNGRLVMFGGSANGQYVGDTWEWDGQSWLWRTSGSGPRPRADYGMAYDSVRKRVVLFGGASLNALAQLEYLDDTWEWDGVRWEQIPTPTAPVKRMKTAMAYDSARHVVVLYGGRAGGVFYSDTWEWNGTTWTDVTSGTGPGPRFDHAMAELPGVGIVLAGNSVTATWTRRSSDGVWVSFMGAHPGARANGAMAYDPSRGTVVFLGGTTADKTTWEWNGSTWLSHANGSAVRSDHAMGIDPITNRMLVHGGVTTDAETQTVAIATAIWSDVTPSLGPGYRNEAVYDSKRGVTVLYDGVATWEWDGLAWTRRVLGTPQPRSRAALAYDAKRGVVVMFGGFTGTVVAETWEWNGTVWTQRNPNPAPPYRHGAAMAYDAARERVVLFGGLGPGLVDDTWLWDGTTWEEKIVSPRPPSRYAHAMAYDPIHRHTIMLGSGPTSIADCWVWDGATWTSVATTIPYREDPAMAYDPRKRAVILYGGSRGQPHYDDTYAWDGATWTQLAPLSNPPANSEMSLASDRLGSLVMFGTGDNKTFRLQYESAVTSPEACMDSTDDVDGDGLAGCADPDCWSQCAPSCPPGMTCDPLAPHCGDAVCDPIEDHHICPADC